ncbi:MAG: SgcJ/EcaC family oxidoreductase [Stellaceae bacterium]
MWRIVVLVALIGLGSASALAQEKAAIQKLNDAWTAAFNKGDAAAVAAMYAEDAYVLPPGADMVKGRAAIEGFWRQAAQQMGDAKLTAVDVLALGPDAAREIGTVTLKTKAQPPQEIAGKYVVVWRKIGGDWKLATDIWNTNK